MLSLLFCRQVVFDDLGVTFLPEGIGMTVYVSFRRR